MLMELSGILRDHQSVDLIRFSKSIGDADSNLAFLATREAFKLFVNSLWMQSKRLIIKSDSKNAIKWTINPSLVLWKAKNINNQIENLKIEGLSW
ncbi:hypothetical protein PTKIN_Ptkin17bG0053800 [Pterospermum kingtungense]